MRVGPSHPCTSSGGLALSDLPTPTPTMQHTMMHSRMSLTCALGAAARRAPSAASSPIASCSYSAVSSSLSSISARRRRRCLSTSQPLVPEQHAAPSAADLPLSPSSSHLHLSRAPSSPPLPSPYFVARGKRNNTLGVFSETKSGGTRDEICIRHVTGDLEVCPCL